MRNTYKRVRSTNLQMSLWKSSLSPQLIGKSTLLLNYVVKMVSLVKAKLSNMRNKNALQSWLRSAANIMLTLQIADRQWISDNVWKLPTPPKPVEKV